MLPGQKAIVELNMRTRSDGIIDNIRIISSPGKLYSDEAVRLIKEGPSWNPAEENRKKVDDEVTLRILFREM
jgi:hypothetical protein